MPRRCKAPGSQGRQATSPPQRLCSSRPVLLCLSPCPGALLLLEGLLPAGEDGELLLSLMEGFFPTVVALWVVFPCCCPQVGAPLLWGQDEPWVGSSPSSNPAEVPGAGSAPWGEGDPTVRIHPEDTQQGRGRGQSLPPLPTRTGPNIPLCPQTRRVQTPGQPPAKPPVCLQDACARGRGESRAWMLALCGAPCARPVCAHPHKQQARTPVWLCSQRRR